MIALAVLAGYLAGLVIAVLAVAAENSRIAFGGYALYGNGALIVPAILAPFALYPGWAWLLAHEGDRRLEAALYTLGLHFGVGMSAVLEVVLNPQSANVTLLKCGARVSPIGSALRTARGPARRGDTLARPIPTRHDHTVDDGVRDRHRRVHRGCSSASASAS